MRLSEPGDGRALQGLWPVAPARLTSQMSTPEWIRQLEKAPCTCEPCGLCRGTGNLRVTDLTQPEGYDLEPCDQCWGGIVDVCERCQQLEDWDHENG
jgi:hypothetical protein